MNKTVCFILNLFFSTFLLSMNQADNLELVFIHISAQNERMQFENSVFTKLKTALCDMHSFNQIEKAKGSKEQQLTTLIELLQRERYSSTTKFLIEVKERQQSNQFKSLYCRKKDIIDTVDYQLSKNPWFLAIYRCWI